MDRRRFLQGFGGAAVLGALTGCAAGGPQRAGDAPSPTTAPSTTATSWQVTHRYGTTTVPGHPQRVVTLGQTDHDATIALGVTPVAVGGFLGSTYTPFRPWNNSAFPTTKPPVLDMQEIKYEKVAALTPDLILAVMSGITKDDYAKLSQIAPTVAQPVGQDDWAVPYRPHTTHIGQALGVPEQAVTLVDELDAAFADTRTTNPQLGGKTGICADRNAGVFDVLGAAAPRSQFLTDIGMTLDASLAGLAGNGYNANISAEKVDLLDAVDVVIWTTDVAERDQLLTDPLVKALKTTQEGRYVLALNGDNDDLLYSMDWGSVLSNRWALDNALPRVLRAADGDPSTDPNA